MSTTIKTDPRAKIENLQNLHDACTMRFGIAPWLDSIIESQGAHLDTLEQALEAGSLEPHALNERLDLLLTGMSWVMDAEA